MAFSAEESRSTRAGGPYNAASMDRRDFSYALPEELIAQVPLPRRTASRLLVLDGASGQIRDRAFTDLVDLVRPGDLLVFNDTRVLPARVHGRKASGGSVELLLERMFSEREALVQIRASRSPAVGSELGLSGGARVQILSREGPMYRVRFDRDAYAYFRSHGETPLPPYITRQPDEQDADRYQTVFARRDGAVAAPTAGLHFDDRILSELDARGVAHAFVTLHVGAGTFAPVRTARVEDHRLHAERIEVGRELCEHVAAARRRGGRIIAVGTTVVRALETAARDRGISEYSGESALFIYPGFEFRIVDAMLTNFHLPESSLLMLVAAFAGHANVMRAYEHAVIERYRFFSYGDAMFVKPGPRPAKSAPDEV
jgi:S-adenosylmethionine:tRNA ribosyltransferase-isomerase